MQQSSAVQGRMSPPGSLSSYLLTPDLFNVSVTSKRLFSDDSSVSVVMDMSVHTEISWQQCVTTTFCADSHSPLIWWSPTFPLAPPVFQCFHLLSEISQHLPHKLAPSMSSTQQLNNSFLDGLPWYLLKTSTFSSGWFVITLVIWLFTTLHRVEIQISQILFYDQMSAK